MDLLTRTKKNFGSTSKLRKVKDGNFWGKQKGEKLKTEKKKLRIDTRYLIKDIERYCVKLLKMEEKRNLIETPELFLSFWKN